MSMNETKLDLLKDLKIEENKKVISLDSMVEGETRYVRDLRINLKNALDTEQMSKKEAYLIALSIAVNERNVILIDTFTQFFHVDITVEKFCFLICVSNSCHHWI